MRVIIIIIYFIFNVHTNSIKYHPLANGYGQYSYGGSGRNLDPPQTNVIKVTNLLNSGEGSLKWCVDQIGPRICVFEVSGIIKPNFYIRFESPYVTIAGQTAPEGGIHIHNGLLDIRTHNVVIQHITVRVGDEDWNIGDHGYGPLLNDRSERISIFANLFAYSSHRNPLVFTDEFLLANSYIYYTSIGFDIRKHGTGPTRMASIGNVRNSEYLAGVGAGKITYENEDKLYFEDNICENVDQKDSWSCFKDHYGTARAITETSTSPLTDLNVDFILPSSKTIDYVLKYTGSRPMDRHKKDVEVLESIRKKEGNKAIDCVTSVDKYINGDIISGTYNTITTPYFSDQPQYFPNKNIEIYSGTGSGQSRIISSYDWDNSKGIFTVTVNWNTIPDSSSKYRFKIDCSRNAGGWPIVESKTHTLILPENINNVNDDGYTDMDKYLFDLHCKLAGYCEKNGFSIIPKITGNPVVDLLITISSVVFFLLCLVPLCLILLYFVYKKFSDKLFQKKKKVFGTSTSPSESIALVDEDIKV